MSRPSKFVTKEAWGSTLGRQATPRTHPIGQTFGVTLHWEGPHMGSFPHSACDDKVRGIERYHEVNRGWADLAYNAVVCPHGYVFEGRGVNTQSAANGNSDDNDDWYAVCYLGGERDPFTDAAKVAFIETVQWLRSDGNAGSRVNGHRDHKSTECPGDAIYRWLKTADFNPPKPIAWTWNPDVVSDLPIIQEQFQIAAGVAKGEIKRYHGVAAIQNALNVKNGERLEVNGLCGPETVAAWKRWETKHPGTGRATTPDMDSLRALAIAYRFKEPEQAPTPAPKPTPVMKVPFTVMTWNVENKGDADAALDRAEIIKLCAARKPAYFCLQEVYRVNLADIPGYQTYQAWEGYTANSENRAQAILVRDDVALKVKKAIPMEESWVGPKMGIEKDPRVHRYVTGNLSDLNIPVATMHVPFTKDAVEETRHAAISWLELMEQTHGRGVIAADWNSLADGLQAKVGTPAGGAVYGGGLDKFVGVGVKLVKFENLGNRGRSDHPVKLGHFEA